MNRLRTKAPYDVLSALFVALLELWYILAKAECAVPENGEISSTGLKSPWN